MKTRLIFIFLIFFFLSFCQKVLAASPSVDVYRITSGPQREDWPAIYKDKIYWIDPRGGIYGYDLKEKKEFLFFEGQQPLTNLYALIGYDGRYIVYNTYDNISYNVNVYDTKKKKIIKVTDGPTSNFATDYDGKTIVYTDNTVAFGNLYTYNINIKKKTFIAQNAAVPKISGRYIVWYIGTGSGLYDIRVYDLLRKREVDIPNPENAIRQSPDIEGDKLVYVYKKDALNSVRLFDISRKEEKILLETSLYHPSWPSIARKYVVWGKNTAQHVSGVEGIDLKTGEVFEIQEQGSHQNDNMSPIIKNNIVAWMAWRTGNGDIYGAIINKKPPFNSLETEE